ncbi:hypothetical protein [Thalassobaculum litoreum]|uniref:Uncharacterized protein n=1 Tax=Thalassobaculum litoreum DSM 18839 TaxID=1123362 RepID=A0A8G2BMV0_9PROT|nr:hypothetical protein [Thalassobaculum litoreum]SDG60286.1 hypothetical protein SAMN05660686_04989 [Thalassobaculum litoreum DSM 18839]
MSVTQFRLYPEPPRYEGGWRNQEIAEFYRIADIMAQAGLAVEAESGASDEGDPWFIFVRAETGDVIAHFARIDGMFVAASALTQEVFRGFDVRHVIDQMLKRHPLMVPRRPNGARLLLHPSVVLTAFVAAAFVMASDDAQAHTLDDVLQTTFGGPDDGTPDQFFADGAVIAPGIDAPDATTPDVDPTVRKPAALHSQALLEPGAERSTGNQLALISALIMACDLAARETATISDTQSGLDLLGEGPGALSLSSHPVPSVSDPEIAANWASFDGERALQSGDNDALITTITFTNQISDKVDGADESTVSPQASLIARAQTMAVDAAGSSRDDVIVFAVGEDVLMGGGAHDRPSSYHPTDVVQATSQAAGSPLDGQQSIATLAGTSMILVDLLDLVGAAQRNGGLSLDTFVTSFGLPHDNYGIDLVLSQHLQELPDGYETLVTTFLAETEERAVDDAGDAASSAQRASAPAKDPEKGTASSPEDEAAAADPSDNSGAAPATSTSNPAPSTPEAPTAIGHLLRQGEARSLVLTDAIDVLLYEGGDVDVHNFELGKDRLWFYLDADEVSAASYHLGTDGDLVMEFASGETLTLHDVLTPDAPYTFV